jgi:CMP-N,N'-diacetyllegionaminic acid synthase
MKNLAIIPARSGSKGLKDKNIKELSGKPLLAYSIEAARESGLFDEIMVSTDSPQYAEIARSFGAKVPFLRSKATSSDKASSWDAVIEVLSKYLEKGEKFNSICLLQPTSPLRTAQDITEAYKLLESKQAEAITSVCEVDHSPLWTMTLPEDLSLEEFKKHDSDTPRQLLKKYYRLNGAIYIRKIKYNNNKIQLLDTNEYAFIMPREHSTDIDTELDFIIAEAIINK